ncbi:hypothetical protein WJX73_007648 [Symbiochloris irregularis]|uniref:phosphatidyl-N-methylethanolamine N-methyltransferase n=1 Tax=Symbiochloris irregularis TaxID=706552 RepID=A0AAW1NIV0_9CHLO
MHPGLPLDWVVVSALAAPHLLYSFIWFFPKIWLRWFGKEAVTVFSYIAACGKVLQFGAMVAWLTLSAGKGLWLDVTQVRAVQWAVFFVLFLGGQVLNGGVYRAIGKNGVYYGFKLGKKIPWCSGFPFNVVAHPQYIGSVITIWGIVALLWGQAPAGFGKLAWYWTCLYAVTALQEHFT